uniref:Ketoreductase domain-containing protein n=1 Tax=Globisporangium ultimum (strain ATCC 200006 / CBS 805.95 / DAOM BR144) TaxID=431595 RepID=K3WIQ5_GLOUD
MATRVALVTGGSKGIGFAIAQQLRRSGWYVAITSRELVRAEDAAAKLINSDANSSNEVLPLAYHAPSSFTTTTAPASDAAQLVARVTKELGPISALVNAAGISKDALLLRLQDRELEELLATNLVGPIQMCKAVAKGMMQQRKGSIINIGSVVGSNGNVGQTAYSASKSGLVGVTKSLAKEFGNRNIRVNLVEPGFIQTDMTAAMPDAARERIQSNIPLARLGTADEVAKLAAFLASDDASYITGQCIRVDGGLVI